MKNGLNISFIIINYNSYAYVKSLIDSIQYVHGGLDFEIIIVDNNSSEREIERVSDNHDKIKLFLLEKNIGFSKANNFAVENSGSHYLVFVNPDVLFIEDSISPIIDFIENNKNIGACAPKLLNEDMTVQDSAGFKMGLFYEFLEAFFLINFFRRIYGLTLKRRDNNLPAKVGWVSAALLVAKREVFESIGGFDSDYFLNYEDIDLCRCLQKKGYRNYYFPGLKSIHFSRQSFKSNYALLVYSRYMSRRIYARKHYSMLIRYLVWLFHVTGLLIRLTTVFFFYSGTEKAQRYSGYKLSLKSYFMRINDANKIFNVV